MSWHRLVVIVRHEVRLIARDPSAILILIAFPLITIAFLKPAIRPALVESGYPDATGAEHVVPGQAVMSAFYLVGMVGFSFFAEHSWMTWDRLRASPATSLEIVTGKAAPRVILGIAQFAIVLGAGVAVFDLTVRGDGWALVPLGLAHTVSLVLLGVAVTALTRTAQQANGFAFTGLVVFGAVGGAFVPFNTLPDWAQAIAPITPTYWAMRGMRDIVLEGGGLADVVTPTVVLLGMSALFAAISAARFRADQPKQGFA